MPLINGCKYSCEPCIRGHRATSCAHTDRILIEVRKPGRPLESCGHNLNTCQCGRLAESFLVGDVIPNPTTPQQLGAEPDLNFIVTTPPSLPSASSRTSSRAGNKSKVVKKSSSRKKAETSLASPPRKRGSRETSTLIDDNTDTRSYSTSTMTSSPGIQDSEYGFQQQDQRSFQAPPMQYLPPMMHDDYLQYQGMGNIGPQTGMGYDFPPQQQQYQGPSPDYSSRIEDVRRAPSEQDQEGEGTEVRSQYIVASPDSIWRAAPQ